MPSFILIHPTVWSQYINVTDRQTDSTGKDWTDRQRTDNIGRNRFTNGLPKIECEIYFRFAVDQW